MPGLNKHTYFDRGQYSDRDSEREHDEERKRLDAIRKRRVKEATAEVISFSTLNLPCWCNSCSGVSWEPNHTALWELLSFSITPSQSKTFSLSVILKAAVSSQWKNKDYKLLLPCLVVVILVQFDLSSSIFQRLIASIVSLSLSQYSKRLRGHKLNYFAQLSLNPHSAHKRHYVGSINRAPNNVDVVSVVPRSLFISNWQPARFTGSKLDLKWIWLCFPITGPSLDKLSPERCNKHIITPIWHMRHIEAKNIPLGALASFSETQTKIWGPQLETVVWRENN